MISGPFKAATIDIVPVLLPLGQVIYNAPAKCKFDLKLRNKCRLQSSIPDDILYADFSCWTLRTSLDSTSFDVK